MENIVLTKSERIISDCHSFIRKDGSGVYFSIDYMTKRKEGENRVNKPEFKIFSRSSLPTSFDKKTDKEICQELKGKSLVIETKINI